MQLYFNSIEIHEQVQEPVVFDKGAKHDSIINDNLVRRVENIMKKDYYKCDKTYLPCMDIDQEVLDSMIVIEKEAVIAAWRWYGHHLNIAVKLFRSNFSLFLFYSILLKLSKTSLIINILK
jgi:hypothetical protein